MAGVTFAVGAQSIPATLNTTSGEWTAAFDSLGVADGPLTVSATARDAAGNTTTSAAATLQVKNADTQAPTAAIVAPANGATVKATVTAKASATDDRGVTGVSFYAGARLIGPATLAADGLWTLSFNTKTSVTPNGVYLVSARATDAAGNVGVSPTVSVTIKN